MIAIELVLLNFTFGVLHLKCKTLNIKVALSNQQSPFP